MKLEIARYYLRITPEDSPAYGVGLDERDTTFIETVLGLEKDGGLCPVGASECIRTKMSGVPGNGTSENWI